MGREEKGTEQGSLGAPGGKARSGSAGIQQSLQLQSRSSCGARGVLGQVGHRVALGGADANGDRRSSFQPMPPPFPDEFCIPPDEDTWAGLEIASVESLLASSFPLSHPE